MNEPTPKIEIRGLYKSFGPKHVLRGLDLDIPAGRSLVVIGGSGTGKSVLIKCILGIVEADKGSIRIDGEEVVRADRATTSKRISSTSGFTSGLPLGSPSTPARSSLIWRFARSSCGISGSKG